MIIFIIWEKIFGNILVRGITCQMVVENFNQNICEKSGTQETINFSELIAIFLAAHGK